MLLTFLFSLVFLFLAYHFLNKFHMLDHNLTKTLKWYKNYIFSFLEEDNCSLRASKNKTKNSKFEQSDNVAKDNKNVSQNVEVAEQMAETFRSMFSFKARNEYEMAAQDKILNFLSNNPSHFVRDGEKKLIIPLEAIAFLNKDIPPLVTEDGNILIKIEVIDKVNDSDLICLTSEEKELKEIIEFYGVENLKSLIKNGSFTDKPKDINKPKKDDGLKKFKEQELNNNEVPKEEDLSDLLDNDDDFTDNEASAHSLDDLLSDFEIGIEDDVEHKDNAKYNNKTDEDNTVVKKNLPDNINKDKEHKIVKNDSINDFLKNKKWEVVSGEQINFSNIGESILHYLENNKYKFFNNIIKHKFLIFKNNKTAVFLDKIIIMNAIARMTGNKYKETSSKFSRLRGEREKDFFKSLSEFLEPYSVDKDKVLQREYFEKNNVQFFSYGSWVSIDTFAEFLMEDFDLFRTYPFSFGYNISTKGNKPLIVNNLDIEI